LWIPFLCDTLSMLLRAQYGRCKPQEVLPMLPMMPMMPMLPTPQTPPTPMSPPQFPHMTPPPSPPQILQMLQSFRKIALAHSRVLADPPTSAVLLSVLRSMPHVGDVAAALLRCD